MIYDYVRRHIFAPAEMLHCNFFRLEVVNVDVAEGCDPLRDEHGALVAWKKNICAFPPIGSPDSGANVTAADLDRFLRKVKAGTLLSAQTTAAFFTPQVLHHPRIAQRGWATLSRARSRSGLKRKEKIGES